MSCTGSQTCPSPTTTLDPVYIGDDLVINLTVKDSDGNAVDLTGSSMALTIKEKKSDSIPVYQEIQDSTDMLDPLSGLVLFLVGGSVTSTFSNRNYVYDIVWERTTGSHATIVLGNFQVKQPVHTEHPLP